MARTQKITAHDQLSGLTIQAAQRDPEKEFDLQETLFDQLRADD